MKAVSNEFKAAAIAPVKVVGGSVSLLDGSASYTENDFLQSITLESTGEMFGAVATIATFELKGDNYNLEEKEVYIKYSLQTENGFENIDYGIYKIAKQSVSKNKESTEFVAHSKMLQMQDGNYAELEGFPMTVAQAVSEIASRENFTVSDMSDLPNADYIIQEDLYKNINGANYRSIFAEVAGATGTMAVFNNTNNNLFFREYQSTVQQSLDYSYLKKYQIGEHYGAINTLVLARTPQEDNIVVKDEAMIDAPAGKNIFNFNSENIVSNDADIEVTGSANDFTITAVANYGLISFCVGLIDFDRIYKYHSSAYTSSSIMLYCSNNNHYGSWNEYTNDRTLITGDFSGSSVGVSSYSGKYLWVQLRGGNSTIYRSVNYTDFILAKEPVSQYEPFVATGSKEVKLANNEILDDDRETLITPIFNAIKGMEWTGFEIDTVGLGWLECGDRISITDDSNGTIEGIITYLKITIDGGIKETIKGIPPIKTETNYAIAGGVMKTIYNTEIKVDKQNQEIQSIVSEQTAFENQTTENFTNITQNISSVVTSVQGSGGNNLIKNSAFFASDDSGRFFDWEMGTESTILPPEYQQVEYIESTGAQYTDSGIIPNDYQNHLKIETDIQYTSTTSGGEQESGYQTIMGANYGLHDGVWTNSPRYQFGTNNQNQFLTEYTIDSTFGATAKSIKSSTLAGTIRHRVISNIGASSQSISIDGAIEQTQSNSVISGALAEMYIFTNGYVNPSTGASEHSGGRISKAKIYELKVYNSTNNALIANYVPSYNVSTKQAGFYETKTSTFHASLTGVNFVAGQATGIPIVYPSAEVAAHGSLSGQVIGLAGVLISQAISVKADDSSITEENKTYYSFSCRCKKNLAGTASITITDGTEEGVWTIDFPNGTDADWEEFNIDKILPQSSELRITATGSSDSDFQITDMMLAVGDYHSQWQQASGESNNTQVSITTDGITVKNGNLATSWSRHNNQGFNAYKDRQLTASLNADEVIAPKAEFSKEIDMPPIKIVPQSDGWAFVSTIS